MYVQKQKELQKQYDKQEKKLKELKAGGKSTKQAVSMAAQPNTQFRKFKRWPLKQNEPDKNQWFYKKNSFKNRTKYKSLYFVSVW